MTTGVVPGIGEQDPRPPAATTAAETASPDAAGGDDAGTLATNDVLRDIARGGLAGLVVGVLLAGVGGRLVMRLAALLVPGSVGSVTENGNAIGAITLGGSLGLIVFVGLLFGALAGSLWVVISPWLPAAVPIRALLSIPIAVALGTFGLVDDQNRDFALLGRDPLVIASLVALVGAFGPVLVVVDRWLDRRLPHAGPNDRRIVAGYAVVTAIGSILTLFVVAPGYLGSQMVLAGVGLLVVGICTLAAWWFRVERLTAPPQRLEIIGRLGLATATVAGLVVAAREVAGALGVG